MLFLIASIAFLKDQGVSVRKSWIFSIWEYIEKCTSFNHESFSHLIYSRSEHLLQFEIILESIHFLFVYSTHFLRSGDNVGSPHVKMTHSYFFSMKLSINSIHLSYVISFQFDGFEQK